MTIFVRGSMLVHTTSKPKALQRMPRPLTILHWVARVTRPHQILLPAQTDSSISVVRALRALRGVWRQQMREGLPLLLLLLLPTCKRKERGWLACQRSGSWPSPRQEGSIWPAIPVPGGLGPALPCLWSLLLSPFSSCKQLEGLGRAGNNCSCNQHCFMPEMC